MRLPCQKRRWWVFVGVVATVVGWLRLQFPGYLSHFMHALPGEVWSKPTAIGGDGHYYGGDQVQITYLAWKLTQHLWHRWSLVSDHYTYASMTGLHHDMACGPQFWLVAIFRVILPDALAYNIGFVVLPLSFTALAVYYLVGAVTPVKWLRILLAAGATILPLRLEEMMMGHSTGSLYWLVPLYWGLVLHHRKADPRDVIGIPRDALAGLVLVATVIGEEHQGMHLLLTSALVFLTWGLQDLLAAGPSVLWKLPVRWKWLLAGLPLVGLWALLYRHYVFSNANGSVSYTRGLWEPKFWGRPLPSYLYPGSESDVGSLLAPAVAIGLMVLLLSSQFRSLIRLWRSRYLVFVLGFPICLCLAMGPGKHWSQHSGVYELAYAYVPFFTAQRVPHKMFTVAATFLLVVCAALFEALRYRRQDGWKPRRTAATLGMLVLGAAVALQPFEYMRTIHQRWPGLLLTDLRSGPNRILDYLKTHATDRDIVFSLPYNIAHSRHETYPNYFAFRSHARFADGYFSGHLPPYIMAVARELNEFNNGAPSDQALVVARQMGYTYFLLNKDNWPLRTPVAQVEERLDKARFLSKIMCDGEACLYSWVWQ